MNDFTLGLVSVILLQINPCHILSTGSISMNWMLYVSSLCGSTTMGCLTYGVFDDELGNVRF